jgi:hypothetical protein
MSGDETTGTPFQGRVLLKPEQVSLIAAVALIAIFVTTCTTPPAKQDNMFTSKRHGYSVIISSGWSMHETPGEWVLGSQPRDGTPGVDAFFWNKSLDRTIVVVALPLADGTSLEAWAKDVASITPSQCTTDSTVPSTLGGERAQLWDIHCEDGAEVFKIAAVHKGRGYLLVFLSLAKFDPADRDLFASVMRTFTFTE